MPEITESVKQQHVAEFIEGTSGMYHGDRKITGDLAEIYDVFDQLFKKNKK